MNIITVIPIFRNKFQKPTLFFSKQDFSIGSIIFVPFQKNEKPAIVISTDNLKNKKSLIRRNKIRVNKMSSKKELPLFKNETIEIIKKAEEKTRYSFEEIFQKILTKKTIQEINKINPNSSKMNGQEENSDIRNIKKNVDKLSLDLIRKKLLKPEPKKLTETKEKGIKTVGFILQTLQPQKTEKNSLHSEKHFMVNEIRNYFGETAKKGKGSFGFYLGFFSRVPKSTIYQYWAEVKDSRKPIYNQLKLFWWKIGQYTKSNKK